VALRCLNSTVPTYTSMADNTVHGANDGVYGGDVQRTDEEWDRGPPRLHMIHTYNIYMHSFTKRRHHDVGSLIHYGT